jgi:succinate dehydrogenase hydrophobic anchor subunit
MLAANIIVNAAISSGIVLLFAGAAVLYHFFPITRNGDSKTMVKRFAMGICEGFTAVTLNGLYGVWGVYYGFPSPYALSFAVAMLISNTLHIKAAHTHVTTRKHAQGEDAAALPHIFVGVFLVTFMFITAVGPLRHL